MGFLNPWRRQCENIPCRLSTAGCGQPATHSCESLSPNDVNHPSHRVHIFAGVPKLKCLIKKMKHNLCTLAIVLFSTIAAFSQIPGQTDQIILKLKNENAASGKSFCDRKNTGNIKVDSITQKFNAVKIKKQSTGRQS